MDDGSTAGSLDLARDVLDPRVRLIADGRRKGLPHRLNEIAERAGGACHRACKSPHLWALNHWIERIKKVGGLYLGAVEESRLNAIYNLADVFVMPTRAYEMFGMAAIEAQVCGKPVVSSDSGGLKEVVPSN